jgi:3-hydroxyisobutyrate dehydrogenase-like beta-hydroxyacid dehydrogenase
MADCGVEAAGDARGALRDAQCVLSLVTADAALAAARDYAPLLPAGALWLDMNSVSPGTKQAAAQAVEAAGAHYVDVAVMAPVDKALAVPLLLAGPQAGAALEALATLGFTNVRIVGEEAGRASAIKLCRSVMVKGLEALTAEMVLAASAAGVLDDVLASLDASEKPLGWAERADYNLDRMLVHGRRRAAEMAEAAAMLRELGIAPRMSEQTAQWQRLIGKQELAPPPGTLSGKLAAIRANPDEKGDI